MNGTGEIIVGGKSAYRRIAIQKDEKFLKNDKERVSQIVKKHTELLDRYVSFCREADRPQLNGLTFGQTSAEQLEDSFFSRLARLCIKEKREELLGVIEKCNPEKLAYVQRRM